jgi:hypothetical protein
MIRDDHIVQFGDDLRNARDALLSLISPMLAARLPARPPRPSEIMTFMGNAPSSIEMRTRPAW